MAGSPTLLYQCWVVQQNSQAAAAHYIPGRRVQGWQGPTSDDTEELKGEKVRKSGVGVRTGRKWSASLAVQEAESNLRHKDIVGAVYQGRQGLGSSKIQFWEKASVAEKRSMVQLEIRAKEEETRKAKSVALSSHGAWNR